MAKKIQRPIIESLESRILYSADPIGSILDLSTNDLPDDDANSAVDTLPRALPPLAGADPARESFITETLNPAPHSTLPSGRLELVFVDTGAPNHEQLLDELLKQSDTTRSFEVFSIDSSTNGLDNISESLQSFRDIDAVHIISHGEPGSLILGNTSLDLDHLNAQSEQIKRWADTLSDSADILLYGCDLASNQSGERLVNVLSEFTGADVAASDDLTGHADLGGDYDFEYSIGAVESKSAISTPLHDGWRGTLDLASAASHDAAVTTASADGGTYLETKSIGDGNDVEVAQTVPVTQSINEDSTLTFVSGTATEVSVSDSADGSTSQLRVTLSVNEGVLHLSQLTGLTIVEGADGSRLMIIDGTESAINAALDGMTFTPDANFHGGVTLSMTTDLAGDLAGHFSFEDGDASDQSAGVTNNGTLLNGASVVTDATRGKVLSLDGVDDHVKIEGLFGEPASLTLSAWVNLNAPDTRGGEVISLGSVFLRADGPSSGVKFSHTDGTGFNPAVSNISIAGNGWTHVAGVFDDDANEASVYVNGVKVGSVSATNSIDYKFGSDTIIGAHWKGPKDVDFDGMIDDARVYTRALSAAEISAIASDNTTATDSVAIFVDAVNDAPTFSVGDGRVSSDSGAGQEYTGGSYLMDDGRLLVAGTFDDGSNSNFQLARYNVDGSLDTTFGTGGVVTTVFSQDSFGQAVEVQADGKILMSGGTTDGSTGSIAVARYNADGTQDTTFDTDGKLEFSQTSEHDVARAIAIQLDGKIVLTGEADSSDANIAVIRLNSDGSFDTTFSGDGKLTMQVAASASHTEDVAIQADGKIVVGGIYEKVGGNEAFLVRFNNDGTLDTTFDSDGIVTTSYGVDSSANFGSLAIDNSGQIISVGSVSATSAHTSVATRYNSDGSLDTSFSGDGIADFDLVAGYEGFTSVDLLDSGKLIVTGQAGTPTSGQDLLAARINTDGTLDTTFDTDGFTTVDFAFDAEGTSGHVAADGDILIVGQTHEASNDKIHIARLNADGSTDVTFNPTNTLDGNPTFVEGGAAVVLDSDIDIRDDDLDSLNGGDGNYAGSSLTLVRGGGANGEDELSFNAGNGITLSSGSLHKNGEVIATFDTTTTAGQLVITFTDANTEVPTSADVDNILSQITYSNSNNTPPTSVQIDWSFDDGGDAVQAQGGSALQATGSTTVNIIDVSNPASLTVPISQSVGEDTALTFSSLGSNAIVIDSGSNNNPIVTAKLSVTNGTLALETTTGITFLDGTSDGDATITILGNESNINAALDGLEFLGDQDYNGSDTLTVTTGSDAGAEADLHARYKFLNGSLQDETANNFDGTAVGDPVLTADAVRDDVLTFDGDDRIDVANSVSTLGDEVTIAAWVKLDAGQQDNVFLSIGDEFYINLDSSNPSLSMGLHVNGFADNSQSSTHNIAGEGWNHVAATINDVTKETYLYLNGELISSSAFAFSDIDWNSPDSPNMTIASMSDGADAFSGSLDDIRVYNSALSRAEIIAVMGDNGYDSKTVLMTVNAVNDTPMVSGPGAAFSVDEQSNLSIEGTGFSVSDVDAASGTLTTTFSVGEGAVTVNVGNSGTAITSGNGSGVVVVTGTQAQIDSLLTGSGTGSISYVNNSDTPSASTTITVSVNDGGNTGSDPGTTADGSSEQHSAAQTITFNALNDAPALDNTGTPTLTAVTEDDIGYSGMSVSELLATGASGDPITDADGDPEGIAITTGANGRGIWEFSIDSGSNWSFVGTVSETSALLLRATDLVRFNPDGENAPTSDPTFEFRAWDQSTGAAGSKVDASSTGGSTAFSSAIETATISVTGVNDAPVLDNTATVTLSTQAEDSGTPVGAVGKLITSLIQLGNNVTDVDAGSQTGVGITAADTSHGSWWYSSDDGAHWNALGDVSDTSSCVLNADSNTRLYFQPDSDFNGTVVDAITFRAWDRSSGTSGSLQDSSTNAGTSAFSSATESANLTVSGVNDAPRLVGDSIVSNGEFSTDLSGWNPTGNVDHDGTQARFGQIGGANGALSQTLTSVIGETYIVSLDYFDGSATKSQSLDISVVGSNTLLAASLDSGGAADLPQTYQFSFVADSTASTLTFTDTSPDHSGVRGYLDKVSVVTDAQPGTALAYDENDGAVVVDASIELEDVDDTHLESATIQISSNYNIGEDSLAFVDQNDISGTWVSSTGTLSLTGSATLAAYETALQSITYTNASDAPDTATRTVSFNVNDGKHTSNVLTRDVTVSVVNDNPVNAGSLPSDINVTEDVSGDVDISAINLSDVDHGGGDLTLTLSTATGGNLSATSGAGVTVGGSNSAVLTLTGSLADLNTYLNTASHLQYLHGVSNTSGNDADTINVLLNDGGNTGSGGGANQNLGTVNVDITATDDTPTLVNNSLTLHEAETVALDSTVLSATDPNSTDSALTFSVSNVSGGHFAWASSPQSLITSFTQAQINASQVLFVHGGSEAAPSYDVMVSDGNSSTVAAAAVISFTPVNDAPLLASLGGDSQTIANDGTAALVDTGALATLVDADLATNYDAATLVITVNTFDIHDTLGISTAGPISLSAGVSNGSILSVNGTTVGTLFSTSNSGTSITFNGNSTGADINAILRTITFESTSSTLGLRSVDFVFNDGDGTANGGADTSVTTTAYIAVASADDGLVTTSEDTTYSFSAGDFDFTGVTGSNLQKITITSLPSDGALTLSGSEVILNQEISKAQIDAGLLQFAPDTDANGPLYAAFDFFVNSGKDSVTALAGEPNAFTLNGGLLKPTDEILADGDNFGPGGTVSSTLSVAPTSTNIDAAYLSQGSVFFNGFVKDSNWTAGELTSLDNWVQAGGVLISNSDATGYERLSAYYGLSIVRSANIIWSVNDPSHEIMHGPFGSVGNLGDPIRATGSVSYFDSASLSLGDAVIAVDSVSGEPTMVLRQVGSGYVLFTGDEGIFRAAMTGGGTISTANDILVANIFAWATERVSGTTTHLMNIDVSAVNDDPVNSGSFPSDLSVTEDVSSNVDLSSIDLSDKDHSGGELTLSWSTSTGGKLSATTGGGVTVGGVASNTLTLTGTQANLNSFLNTASNVQYLHGTANTAANDADTINVVINDNGNTGTGGGIDQNLGSVNVDITAINDVPEATGNTVTADEDVPLVIDANDFNYSDVEGDSLASVTITDLTLNGGTLTHGAGSVTVTNGMTITAAELADLSFTSAQNNSSNSSFRYTVNDAGAGVTSALMNITVNDVNDAPVATGNTLSTDEDVPLIIGPSDFNFTDTEGDSLASVTITGLSLNGGTLTHSAGAITVTNGMTITAAELADLSFTSALNNSSNSSFSYTVNDADAGVASALMTINVNPINDAPVADNNTVVVSEDTALIFDPSDFVFTDVEGDSLMSVTISALNLNGGTLTHSSGAVTVTNGMTITAAELADLRFLSALNDSTNSSFSYTVNDADNGVTPALMNIVVNAVNDAPVATGNALVATEDEALLIDAGAFLYTDIESDALSSITVSNLNLNLGSLTHSAASVVVANGMQISAAQLFDLSFNPALNSNLPASFDYIVNDADNGEVSATFNISISARNDAPVIISNGGGDSALVHTAENSQQASTVKATDVDLTDTISYSLGGGADADLFEIDRDSGELRFVLAPNFEQAHDADQNNRYEVEVMASDGNGTVDTQSLSFAVINSNESPTELYLSNLSVDSLTDTSGGVIIGRLSALDEDADDVLSFALVGGADLAAFTLVGTDASTLVIDDGVINSNLQSSYELIVRVTDAAGLSVDRLFNITVKPSETIDTEIIEPEKAPVVIPWQPIDLKESTESIDPNEEDETLNTRAIRDESERELSASVINGVSILPEQLVLLSPAINTQQVLAPALYLETETVLPVKYLDLTSMALSTLDITYTPDVGALTFSDIAQQKRLSEDLDIAFDQLQSQHQIFVEISSGLAISLTAGFVSWTLQSGSLLASMMATVPTWKKMDPLVILTASNRRDKEPAEETPEEERIAAMLAHPKH